MKTYCRVSVLGHDALPSIALVMPELCLMLLVQCLAAQPHSLGSLDRILDRWPSLMPRA